MERVEGLKEVHALAGVLDTDVTVMPGNDIRPVHSGPDRSGFVITGAETREEAIALAEQAESMIRFIHQPKKNNRPREQSEIVL